jgi:hypothetical protein
MQRDILETLVANRTARALTRELRNAASVWKGATANGSGKSVAVHADANDITGLWAGERVQGPHRGQHIRETYMQCSAVWCTGSLLDQPHRASVISHSQSVAPVTSSPIESCK